MLFSSREGFCFSQAAIRCLTVASAFVPIAQMKPSSSRPTAVTIFLLSLPLAASLAYRLCSRCCAFHAISAAWAWMEKSLHRLSSKSETAAAIRYALSRWSALTRYIDDGMLEIDNSAAERTLRAVAVGRKIFFGSDCGGERAAAMYFVDRIGEAQWSRPGLLSPHRAGTHRRLSHQPHSGPAALESHTLTTNPIPASRLDTLNRCPPKISRHFLTHSAICQQGLAVRLLSSKTAGPCCLDRRFRHFNRFIQCTS